MKNMHGTSMIRLKGLMKSGVKTKLLIEFIRQFEISQEFAQNIQQNRKIHQVPLAYTPPV
jgi:hypothetical protein